MLACVMAVASTAAPAPVAVAAAVSCSGHSTAAALRTVRASSKSKYFARLCAIKDCFIAQCASSIAILQTAAWCSIRGHDSKSLADYCLVML
eukprot:6985-Heterococcus_DN1.PRE.2